MNYIKDYNEERKLEVHYFTNQTNQPTRKQTNLYWLFLFLLILTGITVWLYAMKLPPIQFTGIPR